MVMRTRLIVTFYVQYIACIVLLCVVQVQVSVACRSIVQRSPTVYVCDQTQQNSSTLAAKCAEVVND